MRVQIPLIITFIVGIALIVAIFVPHDPFHRMNEEFSVYFDLIAVFAFILGGGNLLKIHGNRISRRSRDWKYSIVTVVGFLTMLIVGAFKIGGPPGLTGDVTAEGSWFKFMYDSVFVSCQATMFSLLAFFVASASYRAFRAKTKEATLLLIAAFIILIGRTPLGHYMTGWLPQQLEFLHIPNLSNWILSIPNMAGQRAIMIGIALGIISTSLKLILGIERSYLGGEGK
ncbi:MAG: hypothetical protein JSW03_07745 [Candidatus Eiseniibacteriota bacterium]|nr:MAG: hypothetical protein JSW03_07745 [Candidatus Eisenbacteria bacterium]